MSFGAQLGFSGGGGYFVPPHCNIFVRIEKIYPDKHECYNFDIKNLSFSPELKIACFETFCDTHLGQCQKHTLVLDFLLPEYP